MTSTMPSNRTNTDFDFLIGNWKVHHRRLKERLANCTEWVEFEGTCAAQKILDGQGNVDDNVLFLPEGPYRAAAMRCYDPESQTWAIWWLDARFPKGPVDPPMVGKFTDGEGLFLADETFKGRPIRVRFRWTDTKSKNPRWEQAFSEDGGATWETNWMMVFTRDLPRGK